MEEEGKREGRRGKEGGREGGKWKSEGNGRGRKGGRKVRYIFDGTLVVLSKQPNIVLTEVLQYFSLPCSHGWIS